jgi:replicative DNA helicase
MVSYASRVPLIAIDDGIASEIELAAWRKAAAAFKTHFTRAIDMSSPTPRQVQREAKRAQTEIGLNWLVVDSATRMQGVGDSVYERMSSIANGLQNLARDMNVPVIMTSQIGRDVTDRPAGKRQPRLDDAYGSGAIEQNAGVVLGLYRHDYYATKELETIDDQAYPPHTARLILLKHRNRPMPDVPHCTVRYEAGCGFYPYQPHVTNRKEKSA